MKVKNIFFLLLTFSTILYYYTSTIKLFYITSQRYIPTIIDNICNIIKCSTILNYKTKYQYKGDYFFSDDFKIRMENRKKIERNIEGLIKLIKLIKIKCLKTKNRQSKSICRMLLTLSVKFSVKIGELFINDWVELVEANDSLKVG